MGVCSFYRFGDKVWVSFRIIVRGTWNSIMLRGNAGQIRVLEKPLLPAAFIAENSVFTRQQRFFQQSGNRQISDAPNASISNRE